MPSYFATPGSPFNDEDARALGPELQRLAESGVASVKGIVEYARSDPSSSLYEHLELHRPVEVVAEKWYRRRARLCAASIMVNVYADGERRAIRAFHHVSIVQHGSPGPARGRRYVTVQMVRDDADLSEQVVERARRELDSWTRRYAEYRHIFGPVFEAVEATI